MLNKFNIKSYIVLISVTTLLILFSTFLLKESVTLFSGIGTGKIEKVAASKKEALKPVTEKKKKSNNKTKVRKRTTSKRTRLKPSKQVTKKTHNNNVKSSDRKDNNKEGASENTNTQDELYNTVKDKINIQKEEAKNIFAANILKLFGSSVNIADNEMTFTKTEALEETVYEWSLSITDSVNKEFYSCELNAMTGECTKLSKINYKGFDKPEDAVYTTGDIIPLNDEDTQKYISKAEELINNNGILNSSENKIQKASVKQRQYMGLRPMVDIDVTMENGGEAEIAFYTDTEQLMSININK
ncbi:hypothetical protein [Clostridium oryzae]|uniref:Uncharacterized protein n=1 Tax=Clostridium oryzae TaxID=1450648 RepID=A0A1V4INP4_9CLOT|nr:hypothetical protein [Clostridium oryzae]OPJ61395.1 hypothetical protein CLORY_22610 [Clostridium oryzae]